MIDLTGLELTLHKGTPTFGACEEPEKLYIYKDYGDGTGILTDGQNCYFAYNNLKSVGDLCPPDAKFMTEVEKVVLKASATSMKAAEDFKKTKPEATEKEVIDVFKGALATQVEAKG